MTEPLLPLPDAAAHSLVQSGLSSEIAEPDFYQILLQAPVAMVVLSGPQNRVVFANHSFLLLAARTREELLYKPVFEVLPSASSTQVEELLKRIGATGEAESLAEYRIEPTENSESKTRWINLTFQPLKDINGSLTKTMVSATEVTQQVLARRQKEAEESLLLQTKNQLELSISIGHIGIWHWDVKTGRMTWSREQLSLYGLTEENFSGHVSDFHRLVLPQDLDIVKSTAAFEQTGSDEVEYQFRVRRADGQIRWMQGRSRSFFNEGGELIYRTGVNIDITERKRAEEALTYQKQLLETVTANTDMALFLMDENQRCIYMNEAAEALTGFGLTEIGARSLTDFIHHSHPDGPVHAASEWSIKQALSNNQRTKGEEIFVHKAGSLHPVAFTASPIVVNGKRLGTVIEVRSTREEKEKERQLREAKEQLQLTIENIPASIFLFSNSGQLLFVNGPARRDVLDITGSEVTEDASLEGMMEKLSDEVVLLTEKGTPLLPAEVPVVVALRTGAAMERVVKRVHKKTGTVKWLLVRATPLLDAAGRINVVLSASTNITEQKEAAEKLRESEEKLRSTIDNAAVGIAHVETDGRWQMVNDRLCNILGYTREELLASAFQHITHPDDLEKDLKLLQEVLERKRETYSMEKRYIHKSGSVVWGNLTVSLVRNEKGDPKYFISVLEDVSERKRAEEKIAESEERYRRLAATLEVLIKERTAELQQSQAFLQSVLETTQNGIATYEPIRNRDGRIVDFRIAYVNHMVTKDLGLLPGDIIGRTTLDVFPYTHSDGSFEHLVRFIETGEGSHYQMAHPIGDDFIYLDISLARMGEGATVTVRNVTGQRKAAMQLEELNRQLQRTVEELHRSNEDLQQFAHVASHDLKEPIRKVRTFGSRLEEEYGSLLPERGQLYLAKMQSSAERMFGLIEGVLNYSTINSLEGKTAVVNLNEVIRHIETDLEIVLQQKGARISKEELPAVQGSEVLLNQLFYNLLNNALKFSKPGVAPVVRIGATTVYGKEVPELAASEADKPFLQISVCDNGIGFKPELAGKIFKTFTRLNSRDKYEGTGLGLALCKKILERHSGYIYATGKEGEGACFYVGLPT